MLGSTTLTTQHSLSQTPTPTSPQPPQQLQLQQNIYSTTVKSFSSTALPPLPNYDTEQSLHYDAYSYYNPYVEVSTQLTATQLPLTNANDAAYQTLPITPIYHYYDGTQPTKSSQHLQPPIREAQLLQDSGYSGSNALRGMPNKAISQPVSPSYTSPPPYDFQHTKIELPPPLPPPNPNQQRSLKQQQLHQKQFSDHQHITPTTEHTPKQYNHQQSPPQKQERRQLEQPYDYLPSPHQQVNSPKLQHKHQQQQQQQQQLLQKQQHPQQQSQLTAENLIGHEDEAKMYSGNAVSPALV